MDILLDGLLATARQRMAARALYRFRELEVPCPGCGATTDVPCQDAGRAVGPCRGRREALIDAQRARTERASQEALAALARADVPAVHAEALTGEVRETEALAQARAWRRSTRCALVLLGARGVGKSFAAAWAVAEGPRRPGTPQSAWIVAAELAALDPHDRRLPELRRCGLLVVDDLGCGDTRPERLRERLDSVLTVRLDRGLDTIVTTNLNVEELRALLDERTRDRLRRHGQVDGLEEVVSLRSGRGP